MAVLPKRLAHDLGKTVLNPKAAGAAGTTTSRWDMDNIGLKPATGRSRRVRIDQRVIDREVFEQRRANSTQRRYLVDSDCCGLRLVLYPTGSNSWTYSYRPHGVDAAGRRLPQRTLRLGDLTTLTPAEARAEADKAKAAVRNGRDPAEDGRVEAEKARLEKLRVVTVNDAFAKYVVAGIAGRELNKIHEESRVRLAIKEMGIGPSPMSEVSKADVLRLLDMHRVKRSLAYVRFHALDRFFNWFAERDEKFANPCRLIGRRYRPKRPGARKRVYSATEVQAIWASADKFEETRRDFLQFLVLAALRRQEASALTPANLDRGRKAIVLAQGVAKNDEPFVLPLPPAAWEIVERRASGLKPGARLFQINGAGKAMGSWSQFTMRVRKRSGVADFQFHDVRRLLMSEAAEHGVASLEALDAALNHKTSATRSGVRSAYMHASLMPAKTLAMAKWGEIVAHAVEHGHWPREDTPAAETKVVPLRPVAA
jgi:integrase